jgi:hypothetical protein
MNAWPIAPLSTNDLNFAVVNYDFSGLTASELGDTGISLINLDILANEFAISLSDQGRLIASMAGDLDDLGNILGELAVDDSDQVIADLAALAAVGDGLLGDFANFFG